MFQLSVALSLALGAFAAVVPDKASSALSPRVSGLNANAVNAGKQYFGTATNINEVSTAAYAAIIDNKQEFGQITPANAMKWDATEPNQNQFTFTGGDQIIQLAKQNSQIVRGHNLVWHQQLPSWVTSSNFNSAQLTSVIQNHIANVAGHFKGEVFAWDVVNEPLNDDGTFRSDVFFNTLGQNYITIALQAARKADPNAKLFINDFNIEGSGAKSTAMQNLVKSLKSAGTPIDAIGFESHFILGEVPSTLQSNMQAFTALGVQVAVTELDVRMTLPSTSALLTQQMNDYTTVVKACRNVAGCVGVTLWDFTDEFSWVPSTFAGQGAACPWDQNFQKKPAYQGIVNALS